MSESVEKLWQQINSDGVASMSFLLNKVDQCYFEKIDGKNYSLISYCLAVCTRHGKSQNVENDVLNSGLIKRILILYRDYEKTLSSEQLESLLQYCLLNWDASANVVAYNCVDIFSLLLSNHSTYCDICRLRNLCPISTSIVDTVMKSISKSKARFKCIGLIQKSFDEIPGIDKNFINQIYHLLENPALSVVISELIEQDICEKKQYYDIHLNEIVNSLVSDSRSVSAAVKDRVIPILMKNSQIPDRFLQDILLKLAESRKQSKLESVLSIVRFAVFQPNKSKIRSVWTDFIDYNIAAQSVIHIDSEVRIAMWSLLTDHPKKTQPFTVEDFKLMKIFISTNLSEQLPASQQRILTGLKKMLMRICEAGESYNPNNDDGKEELSNILDFIRFLIRLAFESLSVEANFPRRLMGLSIIDYIFCRDYLITKEKSKILKLLDLKKELTMERFSLLLSNLDNDFQLCQMITIKLLCNLYPKDNIEFDFSKYTDETLDLITSVRTQDTLSSGYRLQYSLLNTPGSEINLLNILLERCEANVTECKKDLMNITTQLVHPYLNAISYLFQETWSFLSKDNFEFFKKYTNKLLPLCFEISRLVTPVVHSLSPEGFIPDEELASMTEIKVQSVADTSQLLLACCWRAHKFVSSIFGIVISKHSILTSDTINEISKYFWLQLTECKHCGAFESAVEGFSQLCTFLWSCSNNPELPNPSKWADEIILALEGKTDSHKLCSTRRSAGVPHLVTTILATEPADFTHAQSILPKVLDSLINMKDKDVTYRIHCLNILRAVISSSLLRERITFALEKSCSLAIAACSADSWPERNAGAQLAAALRVRIFGVTRSSQRGYHVDAKNKLSAFDFFTRFPSLYSQLYSQLTSANTDDFKCYPILIFLSHIFPTVASQFPLAPFIPACLSVLFTCKAEKLRNLTAATIIAISQEEDISYLLSLLNQYSISAASENVLHSILILIQNMLITTTKTDDHMKTIYKIIRSLMISHPEQRLSDFNKNIMFLLCNEFHIDYSTSCTKNFILTWRPLASQNLAMKDIQLHMENKAIRFEYYRTATNISGFKGEFELIEKACQDLAESTVEREISEITLFLINNVASIQKSRYGPKLAAILSSEHFSKTLKTKLLGRKVKYFISEESAEAGSDVTWLKTVSDYDEDDSVKEIAMEISEIMIRSYKPKDFIANLSLFLQDESEDIRQLASKIISKNFLQSSVMLNPDVCFRLVMADEEVKYIFKQLTDITDKKRDGLFDACASRPFAESKLFGESNLILEFVHQVLQ